MRVQEMQNGTSGLSAKATEFVPRALQRPTAKPYRADGRWRGKTTSSVMDDETRRSLTLVDLATKKSLDSSQVLIWGMAIYIKQNRKHLEARCDQDKKLALCLEKLIRFAHCTNKSPVHQFLMGWMPHMPT